MLFSANTAVEQEVIVAAMVMALFYLHASDQGRTQERGLRVKLPHEFDILQKLYYLRKRD